MLYPKILVVRGTFFAVIGLPAIAVGSARYVSTGSVLALAVGLAGVALATIAWMTGHSWVGVTRFDGREPAAVSALVEKINGHFRLRGVGFELRIPTEADGAQLMDPCVLALNPTGEGTGRLPLVSRVQGQPVTWQTLHRSSGFVALGLVITLAGTCLLLLIC
jgi:hypothetical protein